MKVSNINNCKSHPTIEIDFMGMPPREACPVTEEVDWPGSVHFFCKFMDIGTIGFHMPIRHAMGLRVRLDEAIQAATNSVPPPRTLQEVPALSVCDMIQAGDIEAAKELAVRVRDLMVTPDCPIGSAGDFVRRRLDPVPQVAMDAMRAAGQ